MRQDEEGLNKNHVLTFAIVSRSRKLHCEKGIYAGEQQSEQGLQVLEEEIKNKKEKEPLSLRSAWDY